MMQETHSQLLAIIKEIHFAIVKEISGNFSDGSSAPPHIAHEETELSGDVSYDIDVKAEDIILSKLAALEGHYTITLVMEGLGKKTITTGGIAVTVIFDPIDGTREIMYDKRSAWILTGISFSENPTLNDIAAAVQTEIPVSKQQYFSFLSAVKGGGAYEEIYHKETLARVSGNGSGRKRLAAKNHRDLEDGFVCFPHPFPGVIGQIARKYEQFCKSVLPEISKSQAPIFSDEYLSTGGQIYLLAVGTYRLVADIRGYLQHETVSLCCHPYDLCTALIAQEAGARIVNLENNALDYPLDTTTNCSWAGFANNFLYERYHEPLFTVLRAD